jgi:hypothetical protein
VLSSGGYGRNTAGGATRLMLAAGDAEIPFAQDARFLPPGKAVLTCPSNRNVVTPSGLLRIEYCDSVGGHAPPPSGLPVLRWPPCKHAVAATPAGSRSPVASCLPSSVGKLLLRDEGLPRYSGGSAPASPFSRPARRSLALPPVCSLSRLATLCHQRLRQFRHLHCPSDCFRLERPVVGWDLHPRETNTFSRGTE